MILWVVAVVGFCILVQLIRSRDQFLDVRRPGDRFGQAAVVILIAGGLAYDSTLVGGSRVIQVVIVAGVLVATIGQLATAGRSNPPRLSLLAFAPMLLAFYMFLLSGFNAVDTGFFGRLAPVVLWGCLGVLLISGAIRVRSLLLVIVGASCCVGMVLPFMADPFAPCTQYKCGLFQELLTGPFSSGNYLAQLASLALLVGAFCFKGLLRVAVIALNALLLVATDSRTSQAAVLLGLLVGWLVLTISVNIRRNIGAGTVGFVAWAAGIGAAGIGCYTIYNSADGDFSDRANIWARGVRVLGDGWLTGLGGDAWLSYQATGALPPLFPHSQYLMMLFWGGVAGIVGYLVILASTLSSAAGTTLLPFAASVVFFMLALGMTEAYWNPAAVDGHSFFILLLLAIAYRGAEVAVPEPIADIPPPSPSRRRRLRSDPASPTPAEEPTVPVHESRPVVAPKVSVVVAAYNAGRYIDDLRRHLTALTMIGELEVIIVDDASTDGSAAQLRELADTVPLGRYLHTGANGGVAAARNLGVSRATADYVWFVDCDDTWDPTIVQTMYTEIRAANTDLAVCRADLVAESGEVLRQLDVVPRNVTVGGRELLHRVLTGSINGYLWNKLFRRTLFTAETFPLLTSQSDLAGLIAMLPAVGSATLIERTLYFHVVRAGSITTSKNPNLENLRRCAAQMDATLAAMRIPRDCRGARYFYTKIIRYSICNTGYRLSGQDPATTAVQERARREIELRDVLAVGRQNVHDGLAVAGLRYARPVYRMLLARRWQRLGRKYFAPA